MFTSEGWDVVNEVLGADLVVFTGGADVSPHMYGEDKHPNSFCDAARDDEEERLFHMIVNSNVPMAGICRGGQFLHVMNGGSMYQHVHSHAIGGTHEATDALTGEKVNLTSTHHQMMVQGHGKTLAYATDICMQKEQMTGEGVVKCGDNHLAQDLEVAWHEDTKSLCFQPHPEFEGYHECRKLFFSYLTHCFNL
jgi:gamma-glutamyl-gamma-aminobutyrate hydrolase PuuD